MPAFLRYIAEHVVNHYDDFTKLTIITPSQRAHQYLQEELGQLKKAPFFLPTFRTLNQWISEHTEAQIISGTALLFELYNVHLQVAKEKESFEQFASWGELLLSDFDEIDRYLVNPASLFKNLKEVKEIENWSFNSTELTENQKKFISFWEDISAYYVQLNENLEQKNKTYAGAAARNVSSSILGKVATNPERRYLFAGFNALSPAETSIIKQLIQRGVAEIYVEADDYFLNDGIHEAGHFIRRLKKIIPETKVISSNLLASDSKKVQVVACSGQTSQAKFALGLLSEFSKEDLNETLLLLADETLIVPVVKNLPATIQKANITLGLPLQYAVVHPWVGLLFSIQEHFSYFNTSAAYHKDVVQLFNNPLFQRIATKEDNIVLQGIQDVIVQKNYIFSNYSNWNGLSDEMQVLLALVFTPWKNDYVYAIDQICSINERIFRFLNETYDLLERSALFQFDKAIKELKNTLNGGNAPELSLSMFKFIFQKHYTSKSVAYYGNPTDGLQVMGILETRMLDFKNLIVLGMNEGNLPPTNPIRTIIPMDLRSYFNMPVPADKEALTAHHFYRLLPAAKHIWISYFSGESALGSECSRYIRQLEMEWAVTNPAIQFEKTVFQLPSNEQMREQCALQNDDTRAKLNALFAKGISASAMNTFLTCPLDFYYRYIVGLREDDEVEEDVEVSTFGTLVHETLEELYLSFIGKQVTASDVQQMKSDYAEVLTSRFAKQFNHNKESYLTGKNYISYQIASKQVANFLDFECVNIQQHADKALCIKALEQRLEGDITILYQGESIPVRINGVMDRIDQWGDESRIVDYKTGACDEKKVSIVFDEVFTSDFDTLRKKLEGSKYVLQLSIYFLLHHQIYSTYPDQCAIMSFRNQKSGYQLLNYNKGKNTLSSDEFLSKVHEMITCIVTQMLDTSLYEHNKGAKYCKYC